MKNPTLISVVNHVHGKTKDHYHILWFFHGSDVVTNFCTSKFISFCSTTGWWTSKTSTRSCCKAVLLNQFFDWIWYHRVVFIGVTTVIRKWIWSEFSKLLFHLMNELAMDLLQIAFILIFIEKDGRVVYTITSSNLSQEPFPTFPKNLPLDEDYIPNRLQFCSRF